MPVVIEKDALIIGGGIAGLWLLNRLKSASYRVMLLDKNPLGSGQSIASQGMIHGGIKYALSGSLTSATSAIADMPAHWRACLSGQGDVDLRGTRLLSEHYYMWPRNSLRSRLNAFLGSKALRGKVSTVKTADYPTFFKERISGPLYELSDIVLDVPSLLHCLSKRYRSDIKLVSSQNLGVEHAEDGSIRELHYRHQDQDYIIRAKRYLICSGEGSAGLLHQMLPDAVLPDHLQMQLRPLQMVLLKHELKDPVYVHCVADQLSTAPEVTITSHPCSDGKTAWYLGGELAESGASRSPEEQIKSAREKLAELFPWVDLSQAQWHSFFIQRAEAKTPNGLRPESASIHAHLNVILCWPSKLTLAPHLGQQLLEHFRAEGIFAEAEKSSPDLNDWPFPGLASSPWEAMP
jgi:glycerol-3-phosphate dehydrogenase